MSHNDPVPSGDDEVRANRVQRAKDARVDAARLRPYKRALKARQVQGDWPLDAKTLERADLDHADVKGLPDPEPVSIKALQRAATAPTRPSMVPGMLPIAPEVAKHRHAQFLAEQAEANKMVGPWTIDRADLWLVAAMATLFRLPLNTRPAGYGSAMPKYVTEFADLISRAENKSLRRIRSQLLRNHGSVSAIDHRRMEEAAHWQARYLRDQPDIARIVGLGALWNAVKGKPIKERCKAIGIHHAKFYEMRKQGLTTIVIGLMRDGKVAQ